MKLIDKFLQSSIVTQVVSGLILAAIIALAAWTFKELNATYFEKIIINGPSSGIEVGYDTIIDGSFPSKYHSSDLWLVVQPVISPRFYPQVGPISKSKNGKWKGIVYLGESQNDAIGQEFLIFIATATPSASNILKKYHQSSADKKSWNGFESLPEGVQLHDSITVTKK